MKTYQKILAALLVLMVAVITFYSFNLVTSLVSNYQSISRTSISWIPMFMFMLICIILLFAGFNYFVYKRKDAYIVRKYSLTIGIMSLIGVIFSILCGTYVYHNFFGDYVFLAYPFIMLLVHTILLVLSCFCLYISIDDIRRNKPFNNFKTPKLYWLRELVLGLILTFALEKLGAFILLPIYYSSVDGIYVLPYYIQLLIPTLVFATFMIHEHWLHNRKVTIVLTSIAFGYSLASMIYMIAISKGTYPLTTTPLSPVQQLERLTVLPVDFILLYGLCLLISGLNLGNNIVMTLKEKRKK